MQERKQHVAVRDEVRIVVLCGTERCMKAECLAHLAGLRARQACEGAKDKGTVTRQGSGFKVDSVRAREKKVDRKREIVGRETEIWRDGAFTGHNSVAEHADDLRNTAGGRWGRRDRVQASDGAPGRGSDLGCMARIGGDPTGGAGGGWKHEVRCQGSLSHRERAEAGLP